MGGAVEFEDDDTPFNVQSFNNLGKAPITWHLLTRSLHWSAIRLMESPRGQVTETSLNSKTMYRAVAAMLGAYAIETLLKMVIVDEYCLVHGLKYDALRTKDFLPTIHDLVELSKRAGLRTNKTDRHLLDVLTEYSVWAGRYPVPQKAEHHTTMAGAFDPDLKETWARYAPLYEKLNKLAHSKMRVRERKAHMERVAVRTR